MLKKIEINLRKKRNRKEFKILQKLYLKKVNVPKPYKIFEDERKEKFYFEFEKILGKTLFEKITEKNLKCAFLQIIKIHNLDVIHTDLTSKNMIEKNGKVYLIDFGLSFISSKIEDKASDLNLFF